MSRLRNDVALAAAFLRNGGAPRASLVAACMALVSSLLFVVLTVLLWTRGPGRPEDLANVVADPGVRGGYVFGLLLICLAPLTLLRQVLRVGTADREQRLSGLRLAGATPSDVRRIAAAEVALPAFAGGLLGYLLFLGLRSVLGGPTIAAQRGGHDAVARELRLVPLSVAPSWWQVIAVALLIGVAGALAGISATRSVIISPLGVSRRAPRSAPRPWGAALMLLAAPAMVFSIRGSSTVPGAFFGITGVALLVVGLLGLTPWMAYRIGVAIAGRARTPHVLLAARRLASDPRPAARASAVVGALGLVAGAGGVFVSDLPGSSGGHGFGEVEAIYTVPAVLVGVVMLAALVLVVLSLAVHSAETLMDRKRAIASLAALGTTYEELERVQRWEVGLVAVPVAALGVLIGSVPFLAAPGGLGPYSWIPVLTDASLVLAAWGAVLAAARLTRPWLVRATAPAQLRTT